MVDFITKSDMTLTFDLETVFKVTAHLLTKSTLYVNISHIGQGEKNYGSDKDFTHKYPMTKPLT